MLCRAMEMTFWLPQAEATLAQVAMRQQHLSPTFLMIDACRLVRLSHPAIVCQCLARCSAVRHASACAVSVGLWAPLVPITDAPRIDRKSTRLNSSHDQISYAVFCLKKKKRPLKSL